MNPTLRVLAVAQNETTLRLCLLGLGLEGMDVSHAADGEEAIEIAVRTRPDVIVLDATEAASGGVAVLRELRSHARTGAIPVVALAGGGDPAPRLEWLVAGASAQITKPFSLDELSQTVRRFGRMSRNDLVAHRGDLLSRLRELA